MASGSLQLMKIYGYDDGQYKKKNSEYIVMINPESLKWDREIMYNEQQAPDSGGSSKKYKYTPGYKLSFDIIIDGTGVVDSSRTNCMKEIKALQNVVYTYKGKTHRPNFVVIHWGGDITFHGVLTNFDTNYTLFKPNGSPLRAKISLKFSSYTDPVKLAKEEAKKSPDMTHLVEVVDGDTLPSLCENVWTDPLQYVNVAEFNGLNKFRKLKSGTKLVFPPLIPSET